MDSLNTPMSEPNAAPILPPASFEVPPSVDGDNGSTAQPTPSSVPIPLPPTVPQVSITFLIISGRRRTMSFDPSSSVGRVKELLWLSWPSDWTEDRPPAPSYLRILYLGRLLQDDDVLGSIHNPLTSTVLSTVPSSNPSQPQYPPIIMHLSIRPIPPGGETDDLKKKRKRMGRSASNASGTPVGPNEDADRSGCCSGCVIC